MCAAYYDSIEQRAARGDDHIVHPEGVKALEGVMEFLRIIAADLPIWKLNGEGDPTRNRP